jgi:hypothetical protein
MRLGGAHLSWEGPITHAKSQPNGLGVRGAQGRRRGRELGERGAT